MDDDESDSTWINLGFCRKLVLARHHFQARLTDVFRCVPPHEAFVGWILSLCSSDSDGELDFDARDFPNLNPLLRFVQQRACVSVDLVEAVNQFSIDMASFWNDCDCEIRRREWLCAYTERDSIHLSYPDDLHEFNVPSATLAELRVKHQGSCFARDVALLYMKYESLFGFGVGEGRGWQLSIPDAFYHFLESEFQVCCEFFASPINRRCVYYFSLFSSDSAFGSLGNFFRSPPSLQGLLSLVGNPDHLTIEANPPFQPLVMMRFAKRFTRLLSEADDVGYGLLGVVILPHWPTCEPIEFLTNSPYLIHSVLLAKGEHKYKPGWADVEVFEADPAYWKQSETLILFLGSAKSRHMHSFMTDFEIRRTWSNTN